MGKRMEVFGGTFILLSHLLWQPYMHSGKKKKKIGERPLLPMVTHYKGTGKLSICRTLSGNYPPSTGLLNSSLSASLQNVTRVQRANISFSDSRSHEKLQGDWNDNGDLTPQGGDKERTQCVLCRRNSFTKKPRELETGGDKVYFWAQNYLYVSAFSQSASFSMLPDSIFILRKSL